MPNNNNTRTKSRNNRTNSRGRTRTKNQNNRGNRAITRHPRYLTKNELIRYKAQAEERRRKRIETPA